MVGDAWAAVALLAAVIAFWNWRISHQKVVLDLLERRLKIHEAAQDIVAYNPLMPNPRATTSLNCGNQASTLHRSTQAALGRACVFTFSALDVAGVDQDGVGALSGAGTASSG